MAGKKVSNVVEKVRSIRERIAQIANDPDLSPDGKARRIEQLKAEAASLRNQFTNEIKSDFVELRKESESLTRRQHEAEETAARTWDYNRLNYESAAARSAIASASTLEEVAGAYKAIVNSGNREKARAWAETGADVVLARFSAARGMEASRLALQMQKDAAALTTPEGLAAIRDQYNELIGIAQSMLRGAQETGEYYDAIHWPDGLFGREVQQVTITSHNNKATGGWDYSLSFNDLPERQTVDYQDQRSRLGLA
jgi:DNA repair exonuclease SbcCD ATPase subunit